MNMETFDETRLPTDSLGSAVDYLIEGMDVSVLTWNVGAKKPPAS